MRVPLLPHSCYMPRPSHPPRLHYSNNTWRRAQITKLLVMQFPPLSCFALLPFPMGLADWTECFAKCEPSHGPIAQPWWRSFALSGEVRRNKGSAKTGLASELATEQISSSDVVPLQGSTRYAIPLEFSWLSSSSGSRADLSLFPHHASLETGLR
jgi:hypothetical protein